MKNVTNDNFQGRNNSGSSTTWSVEGHGEIEKVCEDGSDNFKTFPENSCNLEWCGKNPDEVMISG